MMDSFALKVSDHANNTVEGLRQQVGGLRLLVCLAVEQLGGIIYVSNTDIVTKPEFEMYINRDDPIAFCENKTIIGVNRIKKAEE